MRNTRFLTVLCALIFVFAESGHAGDEKRICDQGSLRTKLTQESNRLSFLNSGGLANGGVCWWHSRFLRNATYLAYFDPEKSIPEDAYVWKTVPNPGGKGSRRDRVPAPGSIKDILQKIKAGRDVVEVPGFANLADFSRHFQDEIQDLLNQWQIEDGFIYQQWVRGLSGSVVVAPEHLAKIMDELHARVSDGEIVYQKLQIEGVTAHAWLVIGSQKTNSGYRIDVIDSNYHSPQTYTYSRGDTSLNHYWYGAFTPYIEQTGEEARLLRIRNKVCD
jgi:hypothetical protein